MNGNYLLDFNNFNPILNHLHIKIKFQIYL